MCNIPDKITAALSLPTVATYNMRSLLAKIRTLTTDILERQIDVSFLCEIWEQEHNKHHEFELEKLLEVIGLMYMSNCRKQNSEGVSYGGAAIVDNLENFSCERLAIQVFQNLDVVWGLLRPKNPSAKFKKIIVCSFYSPPNKQRDG